MQLFDILQDGFHTPLTATQVAELFQAGRVSRHTRCKPAKQKDWRTIDELFPLLKYHSPLQFSYQPAESDREFRFRRSIVVAMCLFAAAAATLVIYLYSQGRSSSNQRITAIDYASASAARSHPRSAPLVPRQSVPNTLYASPSYIVNELPVVPPSVEQTQSQTAARLAEAQRLAQQARGVEEAAVQQRAVREQQRLEQEKLAARDQHVPFDLDQIVNVGSQSIAVRIHDNDTTSFDVWINGAHYHEVKKQKGITDSGTDETLIYSNGRAALYYVWEISGRINHCLLRVRDA